ncbi:asparagine synthase-related protein [Brevibacillus choshinensis]|uniref:asparagine synthase-related protein n=1 Tax=Brevibacillus choshinensis TaxID=54911 RepID=UPI002E223C81|nr:asparagine synthase-related protein [Brevibacillus choshinensis]MED4753031.1 asparagine synthase-related protein [Brevibacillus choshinensis]
MLLTAKGMRSVESGLQSWENPDYSFRWRGFLYLLGIPPGAASVREFSRLVASKGIDRALKALRGHFFMVVKEKQTHKYTCFTDNNGGFTAFHSKSAVATSFLELVSYQGVTSSSLDRASVLEFVNFGNVFSNKTLIEGISRIDRNQIIRFGPNGKSVHSKNLTPIDAGKGDFDYLQFFEKFAQSIREYRLSVDLTGGVDSRLIAVLLDYFGVPFETTVSGMDGMEDVEIAKEVAAAMGTSLYVTHPSIDGLEESIPEVFRVSDGLNDVFKHYRSFQHNQNRVKRGVELALSGIGGEFLKDELWLQDFPFYTSKTSRLDRMFTMFMLPIPCKNDYFTGEYADSNQKLQNRTIHSLARYEMDTNTKTYDNIYYYYELPTIGGGFITAANRVLPSYAPMMELDFVQFGFNLKRRERFFNTFHRKTISKVNPLISRIRTSEGGISVSADKWEVGKDIQKYVWDKGTRLMKVIERRLFHGSYTRQPADHPELTNRIRESRLAKDAIDLLKEEKILQGNVQLQDIHDAHLSHFLSFFLFMEFLHSNKGQCHGT